MSRARDLADSADLAFDGNTLKIDSTNNRVGIGTSSPTTPLHINSSSTPDIRLQYGSIAYSTISADSGAGSLLITANDGGAALASNFICTTKGTGSFIWQSGSSSTERMRIDSSGNLLVGTTSDYAVDSTTATGAKIKANGMGAFYRDGGTPLYVSRGEDGTIVDFRKDGTTVGSIGSASGDLTVVSAGDLKFYTSTSNEDMRLETDGDLHVDGDVIAYSTTISDKRLKENIVGIDGALDKVSQLNGYTFTYKADGKISAGVIAQEVEKVLPEAVSEKELPLKADDGEQYKVVNYDALHGLMIEAIKELKAEVADLKSQLENK